MYRTSTAPPGRCAPRMVSISWSQERDSARRSSSAWAIAIDQRAIAIAIPRIQPVACRIVAASLNVLRAESRGTEPPPTADSGALRAKQQGFRPAQLGLDPSRDGQADRDADQVRDGVADLPIAADRGDGRLDEFGDG